MKKSISDYFLDMMGFESKPPIRMVEEYTPEELEAFREQFKPLKHRYFERLWGFGIGAVVCVFLTILVACVIGRRFIPFFVVPEVIVVGVLIARYFPYMPKCPACESDLEEFAGLHCPECGCRSLKTGRWNPYPKCESCGKRIARGKGRLYKIRWCNRCGVKLDDEGL